jgi:predicted RNA-binding Zn-ribbon protein involved in translation (DUF1610 family)
MIANSYESDKKFLKLRAENERNKGKPKIAPLEEFTPAYKKRFLIDSLSGTIASAADVGEGEHLTSCPKCGTQKIIRTGNNLYPIGSNMSCRNCGNAFSIN